MKKKVIVISILIIIAVGFIISYSFLKNDSIIKLEIEFKSTDKKNNIKIFYNNGQQYTEHQSIMKEFKGSNEFQTLVFDLQKDYNIQKLRIDFGKVETKIIIKNLIFRDNENQVIISPNTIINLFETNNYIDSMYIFNSNLNIVTYYYDPYISTEKIAGIFAKLRDDYILKIRIFRILLVVYIILLLFIIKTNFFRSVKINKIKGKHHLFVLIILFIAFLFTPKFVKYVGICEALTNRENRFLTTYPDYRTMAIFPFFKEYEKYYNDNFGLRDQMVTGISYFKFKYLNTSAMSSTSVSVGKDKWLFPTAYIYSFLFEYFTEEEMDTIRKRIEERAIWLADKGIKYYLVIPPTKARIYPEYLPNLYKNKPRLSIIDQLIEATKGIENIVLIDLEEILRNNKKPENPFLYHKYDTHWNKVGAYFAYRQIIKVIGKDFPSIKPNYIKDYNITKGDWFEADLLRNLAIGDLIPREEYYFDLKSGSKVCDDKPRPYLPTAMFKKSIVSNELNVILFGDSYSMALRPFVAENFKTSVFLWTNDFLIDAIEQEKPDLIIQERMEIYLKKLLNPNPERLVKEVEEIKRKRKILIESHN